MSDNTLPAEPTVTATNEDTDSSKEEMINLIDEDNEETAVYSRPSGTITSKSVMYRDTKVSFEMTNIGTEGLLLKFSKPAIAEYLTKADIAANKAIRNAFADDWRFPWFSGGRPAIGAGLLRICPEPAEGGTKTFFAEGFVNLGKVFRAIVYENSKAFLFEDEGAAFGRQLDPTKMDEWRGASPRTLQIITEQFGVDTSHLNMEVK